LDFCNYLIFVKSVGPDDWEGLSFAGGVIYRPIPDPIDDCTRWPHFSGVARESKATVKTFTETERDRKFLAAVLHVMHVTRRDYGDAPSRMLDMEWAEKGHNASRVHKMVLDALNLMDDEA
jgi:hypothetical protein